MWKVKLHAPESTSFTLEICIFNHTVKKIQGKSNSINVNKYEHFNK